MDLLEIINKVLESNGNPRIDSIEDSDDLKVNLEFDSFMLAELVVEIEEETGIDVFTDSLVFTVGQIKEKLNG